MARISLETGFLNEYGPEAALLLSYFEHWVGAAEFRKDPSKFHDGRYWTYASLNTISGVFKGISKTTIRRVIDLLVKENLLLKGNFNKFKWDKTVWYSLTDKYYQKLREYTDMDSKGCAKTAQVVCQNGTGVCQNGTTIPIQSTYSIPYKGDNKQTQPAKQVNEEADNRFPETKYDQETYGKAMDAYSKYIGYPVEASSTEIVCGMVDDYGLEPVLYGFKVAYKNKVRNLRYVESCARNYDPHKKSPPRRRHKNDVAASVAEVQRMLAEQEARAAANGSHEEEGEVDFAKLLGF